MNENDGRNKLFNRAIIAIIRIANRNVCFRL